MTFAFVVFRHLHCNCISRVDGHFLLLCYQGQLSVPLVEPCCPAQCITCILVIVHVK